MMRDDLVRLTEITAAALSAAQAKSAALQRKESALRQQLHDLARQRDTPVSVESAAERAGATVRWQHWVDRRREEINTELARVLALRDAARARLQRAFGKDQAMQELVKRLERERQAARQKPRF
ncbi:hypothetical protein SAMN04488515_2810 [Cognatiyoonia koreensis]|uniref:Flagellar export protein FliJ n=1 Tax=Cognatiyoonia koreensis TaxID=364200 RepID=A0A1I0RJT4_9RHOB|nr:hypothetical protein [Cognatiyoonia koreensis]SEW41299.1 hypothetical protein SAMN04488515_2810 [Cognatiyoonia koreensis]